MKLGLALGGGAGLGWAHIGVVRALEEEGINISVVAGTSIGAIVGACVAGNLMDELEDIARDITLKEMLALGQLGFTQGSLIGGDKIERRLRDHFGSLTIEQLPKPFAAVAADLFSGTRVVLDQGDVVTAVRASAAIPGVLPPVDTMRMMLVDGGVVDPVPVSAAREIGADAVIAVDLQGDYVGRARRLGFDPAQKKPRLAAVKAARAGWSVALQALSQANLKADRPEVTITPHIGHIDMADFTKADELITLGRAATYDQMDKIQAAINDSA